jgi:hypothetical protein
MFKFFYDIYQSWSKPEFIDRRGDHWIFDYHTMEWFKSDFTPNLKSVSKESAEAISAILNAAQKRYAKR